jgi:hypothetical protein
VPGTEIRGYAFEWITCHPKGNPGTKTFFKGEIMWKDCLGRSIKKGDIVLYPVRRGSGSINKWGKVIDYLHNHPSKKYSTHPCLKIRCPQNTKDVIVNCDEYNQLVNLSSKPIREI